MGPRFVHPAPGRQPAPQGSFGPPPARSLGVSFGYFLGPTPALPASPYGHVYHPTQLIEKDGSLVN